MKGFVRITVIILLMLPAIAFAHFAIFPQETRCILIDFADFKNYNNIYYRKDVKIETVRNIKQLSNLAEQRIHKLWKGNTKFDYKIIYCNTEKDFNNYGHGAAPAATQLKMGAYIVIKNESLNLDIVSHEMAHTVLYRNIGWYKTKFTIPTWFDEGLAMQVDSRNYYSIDSLSMKVKNGLVLPDITELNKPQQFFSGDIETIMLRFSTAKYVVHEWLQTHSLEKFIQYINNGDDFTEAYNKK